MPTQQPQTERSATPSSAADPLLVLVPVDMVPRVIGLVLARLKSIVERSHGALSLSGVLERVVSGDWQLWFIDDGTTCHAVMLTELHTQISGRRACLVHALTGENSAGWLHLVGQLEAWARHQGCGVVEMVARKGWSRRLAPHGYRTAHVYLEREIA